MEDYVPYGEEWKKEIMQMKKRDIVDVLSNRIKELELENERLRNSYEGREKLIDEGRARLENCRKRYTKEVTDIERLKTALTEISSNSDCVCSSDGSCQPTRIASLALKKLLTDKGE